MGDTAIGPTRSPLTIGVLARWTPGSKPDDLPTNFSSASRPICGAYSMKAACVTPPSLGGAGNRAKRLGGPLRRRRTRLSKLHVLDPTRGPEHSVLAVDRLDFPENSTRRCNWPCSGRRKAGDPVLRRLQQTRNAQGDIPQKQRQRDG